MRGFGLCVWERAMQIIIAIMFLGLLWIAPASAETAATREHELIVSIHQDANDGSLTAPGFVEGILESASRFVTRSCGEIKFKLKGSVGTFTSAPSQINNEAELEAVHDVAADIKVVQEINYCMGRKEENVIGCAWRRSPDPHAGRPKTVIVIRNVHLSLYPMLWAHEFGHAAGLQHRNDDADLHLMTPCELKTFHQDLNEAECDCFRKGLGGCFPIKGPDPDPEICCPTDPKCNRGR